MSDFVTRLREIVRGVGCYLAGEGSLRDLWLYARGYEV